MSLSPVRFFIYLGTFSCSILAVLILYVSLPPHEFKEGQFDVHVADDVTLRSIAHNLMVQNVIRSDLMFRVAIYLVPGRRGVLAGDYRFTKPESMWTIAYRMANGAQGLPKIKITVPEGTNSAELTYILLTKLPNFNAPKFYGLALKEEGYLFPETYFFLSNAKTDFIIKEMKATFASKIKELESDIKASKHSLEDLVVMASIIEEEARVYEERRVIAGILWKRLQKGMLLQVDAPFYYITGRNSGVTFKDLKIESPYNTYIHKGLPIAPISNIGLQALRATLNPLTTPYFYYLTGDDGKMYYADTYEKHLANKYTYIE